MGLPIAAGDVGRAWAALTGVRRLSPLQVLARPDSPLGPPGWVGLLELGGTLTVVVPYSGQVEPVRAALACLVFGLAEAMQIALQAAGVGVPAWAVQMLPYLLTMVTLAGFIGRSRAPRALGRLDGP